MAKEAKCPFCARASQRDYDFERGVYHYHCKHCGVFVLQRVDEEDFLHRERWREENSPDKISAVLSERHLQGLPPPFLLFRDRREYTLQHSPAVHVDELLRDWPDGVPERIDRSFVALVRKLGVEKVGMLHNLRDADVCKHIVFATDLEEGRFMRDAMERYRWIERPTHNAMDFKITPEGWAKFDQLTRSGSDARNPVFVAMWFGGKDRRDEMDGLYERAIKPAVKAAGFRVKRADTDEHNEPIMDRIVDDIRRAPFLVAQLTTNNRRAYYEAGFARGRAIEVIYCVPESEKEEDRPHFDVSGINHVRWKDEADLAQRLQDRILGAIGRGPHTFDHMR